MSEFKKQPLQDPSILIGRFGSRVGCKKSRMMQATRLPLQKSDPLSTDVLPSDSADGSGMDEFGYLAVILSIILGLSVTQLLQGLSNVINARDRVRIYWPAIALCAGLALLLAVVALATAMRLIRGPA